MLLRAVSCLAATALVAGCGGADSWSDVTAYASPTTVVTTRAPTATETVGGTLAGQTLTAAQWARTVNSVRPVTFKVLNHGCEFEASGSAVAVAPDELVTNRHVVDGARSLAVQTSAGKETPVASWDISQRDDLALLHLAAPVGHTPVRLGLDPTPGDLVAALGYPLGGPLASGQGRVVEVGEDPEAHTPIIKASMDVLPGNSGGPLVDTTGSLVGLVRAIDLGEGWTLAVPVDRVRDLLAGEHVLPGVPCPH